MQPFEKYRQSCLFYIKVDLALLAAVVTLISVFKVEGPNLVDYLDEVKLFVSLLVLILVLDLLLERWLLLSSEESSTSGSLDKGKVARFALLGQTLLHILIFIGLLGYGTGRLRSNVKMQKQDSIFTYIHNATSRFVDDQHKLPNSLEELRKQYPYVSKYLDDYVDVPFSYTLRDSANYIITLPGPDEKLGTDDDWARPVQIVYKEQ